MKMNFPEAWRPLRFPHKRAELIENLRDIVRTENEIDSSSETFEIDELIHFLFDDTDLNDGSRNSVGDILLDIEEQKSIHDLSFTISQMLQVVGDKTTEHFLRHPTWSAVVSRAKHALTTIEKRGLPTFVEST